MLRVIVLTLSAKQMLCHGELAGTNLIAAGSGMRCKQVSISADALVAGFGGKRTTLLFGDSNPSITISCGNDLVQILELQSICKALSMSPTWYCQAALMT